MNDIKEIQKDIGEIKVSQARMEQDIKHHIKRTDLLQSDVNLFRKFMYGFLGIGVYNARFN